MTFAYITEEGARIQKRGGRFLVGRNQEVIFELPEELLEGVVLIDKVQISSEAVVEFLKKGIPVTWISETGKFFGRLDSTMQVNVFKHRQQILLQEKEGFFLQLCRKVVLAKIHNQLTVLRRYNRTLKSNNVEVAIQNILSLRKNIFTAEDSPALMGYEGIIARIYFAAMGEIVPQHFLFTKRTKQPPTDPVNSMLSFGYTLLMYEIYTAILNQGLHPYFGFFHKLKNKHPALASDLLEEWRAVIIDSMVMSLVQHHEVKTEHFQENKDTAGVYLTREGRKIFLHAYEKKMRAVNQYMQGKFSYRHCLERQAADFSQTIMAEDISLYEPVFLR